MSEYDDAKNEGVECLLNRVAKDGVAVSSVSDGTILVFKRAFMKNILDKHNNEMITIFVKKPLSN